MWGRREHRGDGGLVQVDGRSGDGDLVDSRDPKLTGDQVDGHLALSALAHPRHHSSTFPCEAADAPPPSHGFSWDNERTGSQEHALSLPSPPILPPSATNGYSEP
jgi:hypothetical protein